MSEYSDPEAAGTPDVPGVSALVRVGTGPLATVYRGREDGSGRAVAIKVLPRALDRAGRSLFQRERTRLARLKHVPAILQIDAVDTLADGRPYVVTEFCAETLADLLRRAGRLPGDEVAAIATRVAEALARAHELDLVHGAVSPANVLYRRNGEVVLGDFGTALRQAYAGDLGPEPGVATLFAAPETLRDGVLNTRTDLYGLGAVLYSALTGDPPFRSRVGEHPSERILRAMSEPAPAIDPALCGTGGATLAGLVADLLATDPDARPADADAVLDRLTAGTRPAPEPATAAPAVERVPEPAPPTYVEPIGEPSTDWSGLLDDVLGGETGTPASDAASPAGLTTSRLIDKPAHAPVRSPLPRRVLAVVGAVVFAVLLVVVADLSLSAGGHDPDDSTAANAPVSRSIVDTTPPLAVRLVSVRDTGRFVELAWRGAPELEYAVVVARIGRQPQVIVAHHRLSLRVSVDPNDPYCFLVQARTGSHTVETDPKGIRSAVCDAGS